MPVVNIPEVGRVRFPDSMSQDDISQAASDLYDEKTMVAEREALRLEESEEATKKFDVPKTDAEKVSRFQELVPHGTVGLDIPPTKVVSPRDPAEDTYEAQLKQAGITEKQASQAQKSADLMQEKFFPKPVESTEKGALARSGAAVVRGTAQLSESLNRTLGAAFDWVSDSPVFAVFRGPATGGALAASEEAGSYLTDTANRVRETVKDLSLVEQSIPTGVVGKAAADIAGGAVSLLPSVATAPVPGLPILMAGIQTYGSVLGDAEEGYRKLNLPEDQVREKSRQVASMNGLATSLLTFGFNRFGPGIEKWTEGLSNVTGRNAVKSLANNFGFEFTEEGVDQFIQGVTARHSYDPSKSWESIVKDSLTAAAAGGALAFGLKGATIADQNLNLVLDMQKEGKQFADLSSAVAKETALLASLPPQNIDTLLVKDDVADKAAATGATATAEAVKESSEIVKDTKVTEAVKAVTSDVIPGAVKPKAKQVDVDDEDAIEAAAIEQELRRKASEIKPEQKGGVTDEEKQRQEKGPQVTASEAGAVAEAATAPAVSVSAPVSATPAADVLKKPTIGEAIGSALTELKAQDVSKYVSTKTKLGGWTGLMWDIGSQAKTPEDVQALRQAAEEASAKTRALLDAAKQPGLTDDQMMAGLTAASAEAAKQPAEAYEFATGVKLDGTPKWETFEKRVPGYVPAVPDAKYLAAKGIKAEPVTALKPVVSGPYRITKAVKLPGEKQTYGVASGEPGNSTSIATGLTKAQATKKLAELEAAEKLSSKEPVPSKAEDKPVAEKAKQEGLTIQSGGIVMPLVPSADPESRFASLFVPISASESASADERLVVSFTNKVKSQLSSELSGLEASSDNAKKVVLRGQEITKEISEKIKSNFKKQAHKLLDSKTERFKSLGISDQEIDGWREMVDTFSEMIGDTFRGVYQPIMEETTTKASVTSAKLHLNMMESLLSAVGKGNAKAEMLAIIKDIYGFDPVKESPSVSAANPALGAGAATTPDKTGAIESPIAPKPKVSKKKPAKRASVDDEAAIEEAAKAQEKKQKPLESRVSSRKEKPDVFNMEDEDLEAYLDAQFGETGATGKGLQAGRTGTFTFPSYGAFRDWMDARYAERDIDGMRLAFAEAPVENKKLYIKENKTATDHKKAWILNLATGAALPTDSPPVPRTTPRPGPTGTSTGPVPPTGTSGGGAYTPPPPPAPRSPTGRVKFDTMALTQLLRQFDKYPRINSRLIKAYGRYLPGVGEVELKERLMWDTELANRVLAHEAGHFVDLFLTPQGKKLPFAERLSPLRAFRYYIHKKKAWRDQAKSLSRAWRGPFVNGDPYRDTANELFADFMSAMFNDPEWVNQTFPELHDAFAELLAGKPEFRVAYEEMTRWLEGGTMVSEWRQQQETAAKKTIDDLMKETPKHKESVKDWLKGALVSVWYRSYDKEGRPKDIGNRLSDELEYSSLWAAKENALFVDDFNKLVQPEIEKIDPDVVKARTLLHQYAQARRTIGERRAAGVWIEMNPADARALLQHILNIDPALRSKFLGPLNTATNAGLYDLASSIFREIHDRGDSFVRRITREIDNLNIGVGGEAALMAFNVRGKLLNPGGLTVERAQEVINELQAELSPDKFRALQAAADKLSELFFEVQEKAYNEGLISQKNWDEIIAPNKDNYLPYAVLDYWDGRVGGGMKSQKGTAKDIADITLATQLKTATLNAWRQRQRQVQLLMDIYTKGGTPITVGERLRKPQDLANIRNQNKGDDISRFVLWQDGQPHLVEFPNDPGKTFEKAADSGAFYDHMEWLSNAGKVAHGIMQLYTTFSLPFMVYRNPIRGARTAANRIGIYRTGKEIVKEMAGLSKAIAAGLDPGADAFKELGLSARMAINYANAAFGGEMMPEVRDLVDRQILLPPRLSGLMVADADNLKSMIENGGILAQQVSNLKQSGGQWPFWNRFKPARKTLEFTEKVFSIYEAFEKIYNFQAAMEKGLGDDKSAALTRRAGIPKPGVRGHFSMPMEVFFPWTRVMLQGLRSSLDILKDPDLRAGYVARFSITEALPRLAKIAIGAGVMAGVIKWLMRDDEDENDPVMAEVMRRVNPYKMALDDIIPLMFYDPRTGKYHYFNDFKSGSEVPANYEVVSWRIPSSEEGRTFGPLLYNLVSNSPGVNDKMGRPGENPITAFGGWVQNEMLPGISPAIQTTETMYQMIFRGKNPDDPFRGQPSANKTLFDAGGTDRAQAIAGYLMNQAGWPGEVAALMAMNFGLLDSRASSALKQRLSTDKQSLPEKIPLAKNVLSYDNYAQYRDEGTARIAETELRAKARMAMSQEVREIYDFYWKNYERQDKLDVSDKRRFVIAKDFHTAWGRLKDRGSLFSKTAHAISDEGSNMSRETIRRDIDAAALPYVARWNFVKQTDSE